MKGRMKTSEEKNWSIVRNRVCIRALLIFLGVVMMQVISYMICAIAVMLYGTLTGQDGLAIFSGLAGTEMSAVFTVWISLLSAVFSAIWCGILYRKSDWREENFDCRKAFSLKNILMICSVGVGGCLLLTMLLSFLAMLIPQAFTSYNAIMENLSDSSMLLTVIYVLLIGPVSEELIFRGAILDRFYLAFPFLAANAMQAALFGLYHMNLIQGAYAFCLGFVLGLIRRVTGSILLSMISHILFNATSYALDFFFPAEYEIQFWQNALLLAAGVFLSIYGLKTLWQRYREIQG